jgi:proline iminopeptidase
MARSTTGRNYSHRPPLGVGRNAVALWKDVAVPDLYPPVEPYESGMLGVGDGNDLYWETCGTPGGRPALVLHGGPGSGCTQQLRRLFDPQAYRVVLFDQRGAGRSTPHAGEFSTDLSANTTDHLVGDMERLREHLGIERWLLYGRSWGTTLGLAYAERYPERVTAMVLAAVCLTGRADIHWLYHGMGRYFPAEWDRFRDGAPTAERDGDLVDAYARLLAHHDPQVRARAAQDWCDWEDAVVAGESGGVPNPRYADPRFRMGFARTVTHFFRHGAWLAEGQLLEQAGRLAGVPGVLIHGRLDLGSPLRSPWDLARVWSGSELIVLDDSGHTSDALADHVVAATDRFART